MYSTLYLVPDFDHLPAEWEPTPRRDPSAAGGETGRTCNTNSVSNRGVLVGSFGVQAEPTHLSRRRGVRLGGDQVQAHDPRKTSS